MRQVKILVSKLKDCASCRKRREALEAEYRRIKARVDVLAKKLGDKSNGKE